MLLPALSCFRVAGQVVFHVVFVGRHNRQLGYSRCTDKVFCTAYRVQANHLPLLIAGLARFVDDVDRQEQFADVVQQCRNTDVVQQGAVETEPAGMSQSEQTDVGRVGKGILILLMQGENG